MAEDSEEAEEKGYLEAEDWEFLSDQREIEVEKIKNEN